MYFVYSSSQENDPIDKINHFQKAVLTEDLETLKEIIQVGDKRLQVTMDDLKQRVDYCKEHPKYFSEQMDYLYTQHTLIAHQIDYDSEGWKTRKKED